MEHIPCSGCPHIPYVHASQRWSMPGPKTHSGPKVDPWLTKEWREAHPGLGRGELALVWLMETFTR